MNNGLEYDYSGICLEGFLYGTISVLPLSCPNLLMQLNIVSSQDSTVAHLLYIYNTMHPKKAIKRTTSFSMLSAFYTFYL